MIRSKPRPPKLRAVDLKVGETFTGTGPSTVPSVAEVPSFYLVIEGGQAVLVGGGKDCGKVFPLASFDMYWDRITLVGVDLTIDEKP